MTVRGSRVIEVVEPEGYTRPEQAVHAYLSHITPRREKVLVFVNARRRADKLAYALRTRLAGCGYTVVAHHGSLSRSQREDAEQLVQSRDRIVLVATSTLEIGVDIGDVDLVVLDGPPRRVGASSADWTRKPAHWNNARDALRQKCGGENSARCHVGRRAEMDGLDRVSRDCSTLSHASTSGVVRLPVGRAVEKPENACGLHNGMRFSVTGRRARTSFGTRR